MRSLSRARWPSPRAAFPPGRACTRSTGTRRPGTKFRRASPRLKGKQAAELGFRDGPGRDRTRLQIAIFHARGGTGQGTPRARTAARGTLDTPGRARSAGPGGRSDVELSADLAGECKVDLTVSRHHRASAAGPCPARVVPALVDLPAALSAQVALELAALQAAIVRWSCSRSRSSSSLGGSGDSISRSASMTFARASSRVRP
jgi:hypothetical protein